MLLNHVTGNVIPIPRNAGVYLIMVFSLLHLLLIAVQTVDKILLILSLPFTGRKIDDLTSVAILVLVSRSRLLLFLATLLVDC